MKKEMSVQSFFYSEFLSFGNLVGAYLFLSVSILGKGSSCLKSALPFDSNEVSPSCMLCRDTDQPAARRRPVSTVTRWRGFSAERSAADSKEILGFASTETIKAY